jgi:hypothetical protein
MALATASSGASPIRRLDEVPLQRSLKAGAAFLKRWYFWATHSRLPPMIEAARTVKRHREGILRWFDNRIANGLIEGINSLVQAAKAKARGYRSTETRPPAARLSCKPPTPNSEEPGPGHPRLSLQGHARSPAGQDGVDDLLCRHQCRNIGIGAGH